MQLTALGSVPSNATLVELRWPHNCIIGIHLLWRHFVVWSLTHITWVRVNDAIIDILMLPETYLYVLLCFTSCLKCDNSYNKCIKLSYDLGNSGRVRCYNWYHNFITLCILLRIIQLYIKVQSIIIELEVQSFEFKTISGDLLYTIKSVMASEIRCWHFGSISTNVELWLTLHISTCSFHCICLCFLFSYEFWGNVENSFWFFRRPSLLRLKNDRTRFQNDLCRLFA